MKRKLMLGNNKPDDNTLLLLHFDDNVKDSSMNGFSLSSAGSVFTNGKYGKAFDSKYGGYAHINSPVFDMIKYNEFTIDLWYYEYSNTIYSTILGITNNGAGGSGNALLSIIREISNRKITFYLYGNSTQIDLPNPILNQWVHFAVVRKGNIIYLFENGILLGSMNITVFRTMPNPMLCLGRIRPGGSEIFEGLIDEIRISDIARWTSNFTPPTKPY